MIGYSFSTQWFQDKFSQACASLGSRYTPETNVELPIRKSLLALSRDDFLNDQIRDWYENLQEYSYELVLFFKELASNPEFANLNLEVTIHPLENILSQHPFSTASKFPTREIIEQSNSALTVVYECRYWLHTNQQEDKEKHIASKNSHLKHKLAQLSSLLQEIISSLQSEYWEIANQKNLLVFGDAGQGKSHLLADVTEYQLNNGKPALLLLGSQFIDDDLWRQVLSMLDLPSGYQAKTLLGALDSAAEAAGSKALLIIDAINERHGINIWPSRILAFLQTVSTFPNVSLILSCRSTYLDRIFQEKPPLESLHYIEHLGFSGVAYEAAQYYLSKRGIVRPGAPNLAPEFENPLFLKTCCDFLDKQNRKSFPRGLRGVSSIFDFYLEAVEKTLNHKMNLAPRKHLVKKAIQSLTQAFIANGIGYIPYNEADDLVERILPSQGKEHFSILDQLEREGAITVEPMRNEVGEIEDYVRFTFERLSDHEIAKKLLRENLHLEDPESSFGKSSFLHNYIFSSDFYNKLGIIEALSVQLPELCGIELIDAINKGPESWELEQAFDSSLLLRDQSKFSKRTLDICYELWNEEKVLEILLSIATEPKNPFNALHLDRILSSWSMAERDYFWSIHVAKRSQNESHPVETLILWAFQNGNETIEPERAKLAAITLSWMLSTSSRIIRDRATKSLASLLSTRLELAIYQSCPVNPKEKRPKTPGNML